MLRSRSRKLRQSPGAPSAVHTFNHDPAEPKHSAPFTYFQINAQVIHVSVPFKAYFSPMSLDIFQRSSGLIKLLGSHRLLRSGSIGPVGQALTFVCGCSVRCNTLGKNPTTCITFALGSGCGRALSSIIGRLRLVPSQVPNWESLKVIALDNFHVNPNLSSGNSTRQTTIYQRLVR